MSSIADTYQFGPGSKVAVEAATDEYIAIPVVASLSGTAVVPTGLTAGYAIVAAGTAPQNTDWHDGTWQTSTKNNTTFYAILVPAASLTAGEYDLWVRIVDGTLEPVHYVERLQVR